MSRWTPWIIGGPFLLGFVEQQVSGWSPQSVLGHAVGPTTTDPSANSATCLPRSIVLAALTAQGATVRSEPPPSCATLSAPAEWYFVVDTSGVGLRHLAFDPAGCLVTGQADKGTACR